MHRSGRFSRYVVDVSKSERSISVKLPKIWDLLGFFFSKAIQDRAWDPYVEELKADYARARSMRKSKWARRWLNFCFVVRTIGAVVATLGLVVKSKTWEKLAAFLFQAMTRR